MSQTFITVGWVASKILWVLKNAMNIASEFNSEWESDFTSKTFPVGGQYQIKLPQRWDVTTGLGYQPQGISRLTTTVNLNQPFGIHFEWDNYERLVKLERTEEELEKAYLIPAGVKLAQYLDSLAADWARIYTTNLVGSLGTDSSTIDNYAQAESILYAKACPVEEKYLCLSPSAMYSYAKTNITQFNPVPEISKMFRTGVMGEAFGWEWRRSNSLAKHTVGTAPTNGVQVTGANQSGSSLIVTGTAADTIKKGDKFTIANVNAVNPVTRTVQGVLGAQVFTVTDNYTLTGGADTIGIYPPIFGPTSVYQNVDALPVTTTALTFWPGTANPSGKSGTISLGLTKAGFAVASAKYELPKAVERAESSEDPDTGLSISFVRAWDQREYKITNRFDSVVGFGNLLSDNGAVAIAGK